VRAARRNASVAAEAFMRPLRWPPKQGAVFAPIFSSTAQEKVMPTFDLYLPPKAYSASHPKQPIHPVAAAFVLMARWIERARQREALASLSDHELHDIGISRIEAMREAGKPFWQ
jgi:uncharacterized protein YjiS (DUF1127 family)